MTLGAVWTGRRDGPIVVLVHGLGGSHRTWDPVVPLLADRHRLVAVDLPGGRAIEHEAEDLEDLLRQAEVTRATVAGHSMGGLVATALAERSPELVERLVLVNSPPTLESRLTASSGGERLIRTPVIGELVWSKLTPDQIRTGLRSAVAPGANVPDAFVADLRATSHHAFVGSTSATDRYLTARPLAERLAALTVPVEVVFGLKDQRVDPASLAVYDAVPRARITTIDEAGHSPSWESPHVVAAAIRGESATGTGSGR